jgi:hypothetical protein
MDWQEIFGNWVLVPSRPIGVIHFLGGAFVAAAPHLTYRRLLEFLANQGYVVVATPFVNTFDHCEIAETVLWSFNRAMTRLQGTRLPNSYLPVYGVGHSMGCKLHLLIGSLFEDVDRAGNVLMAFNNFAAKESIPLWEQVVSSTNIAPEFTPSPPETTQIVSQNYVVRRNLLIKFANDTLDQTLPLASLLDDLFPGMITTQRLRGNHLTPLGPDLKWQAGSSFTPIDAIGQLIRQEVFKELSQLEQLIARWLQPIQLR